MNPIYPVTYIVCLTYCIMQNAPPPSTCESDLVLDDDMQSAPPPSTCDNDLVLDDEEDFEGSQPMFQKAAHEGDGAAMVAKEADKETAGDDLSPAQTAPVGAAVTDASGRPSAKVVIVGDSGVGKTALMLRFVEQTFKEATRATVGLDMHTREFVMSDKRSISLQLWDTAGQEQFHALTTSYFRQAQAVLLVYDVHSRASFASLGRWMQDVDRHCPAEVVKMIVGSKCDGVGETAVTAAEAEEFASKHGALCVRCSAKEDTNVRDLFQQVALKIIKHGFNPSGGSHAGVKVSEQTRKKKGCC